MRCAINYSPTAVASAESVNDFHDVLTVLQEDPMNC